MRKIMYKITSIVSLSLILSFSVTNLALAKDISTYKPRSITTEPEGIVIKVSSQEEFDELVQEIQEGNARAEKKWEEAKKRSEMEKSLVEQSSNNLTDNARLTTYRSINCKYTLKGCDVGLILRSDVSVGSYDKFVKVHEFLAVPHEDFNKVKNIYWDYKFLDGNRTCALHASYILSILNWQGNYKNYDVTNYIEYYAKGTYHLY